MNNGKTRVISEDLQQFERGGAAGEKIHRLVSLLLLVRFDAAYYGNFKCNRQHIYEYHNLSNYLRELYQTPGSAEITDIEGIKNGYYRIGAVNPTGIVPMGPGDLHLTDAHDRARLPKAA